MLKEPRWQNSIKLITCKNKQQQQIIYTAKYFENQTKNKPNKGFVAQNIRGFRIIKKIKKFKKNRQLTMIMDESRVMLNGSFLCSSFLCKIKEGERKLGKILYTFTHSAGTYCTETERPDRKHK